MKSKKRINLIIAVLFILISVIAHMVVDIDDRLVMIIGLIAFVAWIGFLSVMLLKNRDKQE